MEAEVDGRRVAVGNLRMMAARGYALNGLEAAVERLQGEAKTAMLVAVDGAVRGVIAVADTVKDSSKAIADLHRMKLRVVMITGDNKRTAEAIARQVGVDTVLAEVLPGDKAAHIRALQGSGIRDQETEDKGRNQQTGFQLRASSTPWSRWSEQMRAGRAHQVTAGVLPGPHQVTRSLLVHGRNRHRGDLVQAQQPGQMQGVLGVGLDPVTRRALQLRRRHDLAPDPRRHQRPIQPEPGRPGLIGHRHRPRQTHHPGPDVLEGRGQFRLEQLARDAIDRRCRDRSGVHVEPHTRTLNEHRGLPQLSDRPSRRPLLVHPRTCVSEAPARNPSATLSGHPIP